ncbi:D-alanyl-D-alanine carboxypeptidase family protein [Paenibacillus soyae]|uniref:D-alanyl-D-alanine carboxypeptidase n=1 Tax=Paenibacillus soyae TaxID=2969249 RepID=A0A9X2SBH2_9BACL|nr:D-alanyl-D-alanine carboxypeptidase family protein [Paenibacillus soyae]MCR2804832.1 D-alanyl-D-alanine carboxypeptidase [Paenibacillus soyae]
MRGSMVVREKPKYGLRFLFAALIAAVVYGAGAWAKEAMEPKAPPIQSTAAFLIDADTGEVLYAKNADVPLPPASMSKMMTEVIVLDSIHEGALQWGDLVTASEYAAQVPGAGMGLAQGDVLTVRELFDAMAIHSANDAAVALAEHVGGSEAAFTERMNRKAAKIGLSDGAVFGNATGLSRTDILPFEGASAATDTLLSAKDTAMLAGYLIGKYPEVLEVASRSSVKVSTQGQALAATNLMLANQPFEYSGSDGLKTGYTPDAGYCFTGTAKRDGKRLISVVMGAESKDSRFVETMKLYELGFSSSPGEDLKAALEF